MALAPGTRIGPYEVLELVGAGGMGEVYRARDSKLDRSVALKILPDEFAADRDRLMRFDREARTLASLNHPHIAQIYGVEDRTLAMEFVDGPTLADLIASGPIPLDEVLGIAGQIAEALEAAHQQGVIHRDLKPANIKVRSDGTVKVLDFGLAKALDPPTAHDGPLADSPTITSPAMTMRGVIMGTAPYMAPEQARGKALDRRVDVWAFGVVVYEMLTGRRAFEGDETTDVLAKIIERDPDWNALPSHAPPAIHRLLRRCLQKTPSQRLRDMGDARLDIAEAVGEAGRPAMSQPARVVSRRPAWLAWVAAVLMAVAAFGAGRWLQNREPAAATASRLTINLPEQTQFSSFSRPAAVLSPAGDAIALSAEKNGVSQIWLRRLDSYEAAPIAGTDDADQPFFSPDGQWIGFRHQTTLKKVPLSGGAALDIAPSDGLGAVWLADDTIVFNLNYQDGLYRVSAAGGKPTQLTKPDRARRELGHFWPQVLPDGKHVMFTNYSSPIEQSRIEVLALDTGKRTVIVDGGMHGQYVGAGYLIYVRADSMVAVGFDPASLKVTGQPVALGEEVVVEPTNGVAQITVAANGTMAYVPATIANRPRSLVWVDRAGNPTEITAARRRFEGPRLSPDGTRVALTITERSRDVWVLTIARNVFSRITSTAADEFSPIWRHSGNQLVFANETPVYQVFGTALSAGAEPTPIVATDFDTVPTSVTADDAMVLYDLSTAESSDVMVARLDGKGTPKAILNSRFEELEGVLSRDGRWLAYSSNESGRFEVYVQAFPDPGERWRVSTDRGVLPRWSRDGKELFFVSGSRLYAAPIKTSPTFNVGVPVLLFEERPDRVLLDSGYDVASDGRFVMVQHDSAESRTPVNVVTNWLAELKTRVK